MDYSTAYKQHQTILTLQEEITEVKQEIKVTGWAYRLAFVATFVVYLIFVWMMYVSDLWGFTSWLVQNLSEVAALIIYSILAITLPLSMALIKEIGYKHFSKYPNPKTVIVLIVGILAFAGVVYESISSSSQQQHISTSAAENSKTFQAISSAGTATIETGSMASLIAVAQQKVARCKEKLKAGKEKHCEGDKAKLQGYLDAEKRAMDSAKEASVAAIESKTKAIQDLKEEAYKPVFKSIRDSFGVSINTGVMLVTLFISIIFEISHLLLILFLGQKLKRLEGLKQNLINQEAAYMQSTGKTFKQQDFSDDSILNMDDIREQSPNPIGFGMPAKAFKYQEPQKQPVGFIRTDALPEQPRTANNPTSAKLGTAETQLEIPAIKPPEFSTYNRELSGHGIDSPPDEALNKAEDKATIQRIINKGLEAGKAMSSGSDKAGTPGLDQAPTKPGAPGTEKRALPVTESTNQTTDTTDPNTSKSARGHSDKSDSKSARGHSEEVHAVTLHSAHTQELLKALKAARKEVSAEVLKEASKLYPKWKTKVLTTKNLEKDEQFKHTSRPGKTFISEHLCRGRKTRTPSPLGMDSILAVWWWQGACEGWLMLNPKPGRGKPKFILA